MGRHLVILLLLLTICLLASALLLQRRKADSPPGESIRKRLDRQLRTGHTGAMTALQAVEAALMLAQAEARNASPVLRGVYAGNIDLAGRALSWDVMLHLPGHSDCMVLIEPDPATPDPDEAVMVATARFTPLYGDMGSPVMQGLHENSASRRHLRERFDMERKNAPGFPFDFLDSPQAMAILLDKGLDPDGSDRDIALASAMLEQGTAVWRASLGEYSWQIPFAPDTEG